MIDNHKSRVEEFIQRGILNITDLEINRSGHLSKRQKRILYLNLAFWLLLAVFDIIILMLFIYFLIMFHRSFITGILGSIFIIIPAFTCITNATPYWKDIQGDGPKTASGKIYKRFSVGTGMVGGRSRIGYCTIRIGNQIFSTSPSTYGCIIHEEIYRIYFVPNSRKLINIEPL
jgi:hypothetical protein